MAIHARIFYYAQRIGVSIDFSAYQSWLTQHPEHQSPDILPEEYRKAEDPAGAAAHTLAWQQAAPKADLYIDRGAAAAASSSGGGEPSYPMAFAEMLKLLQEGKEVPGIKQIPNTVIRDPVSTDYIIQFHSSLTRFRIGCKTRGHEDCPQKALGEGCGDC